MGTIYKQTKTSKKWTVDTQIDGQRFRKAVSESKKVAEDILKKIEYENVMMASGLITRGRRNVELKPLMKKYLLYVEASFRPRTLESYKLYLTTMIEGLSANIVEDISPDRVTTFLSRKRLSKSQWSTRTCDICLENTKAFLNWSVEQKLIAENPIKRLKKIRGQKVKNRRALRDEEAQRLINVSAEPWRSIWKVFLGTGLRHNELLSLKWQDVELLKGEIHIRSENAKGGKKRTIPLSNSLLKLFKDKFKKGVYAKLDDYVFPTNRGTMRLQSNIRRAFYQCLSKASIAKDGSIDIHALRYTFCTGLARRGVPVSTAQRLMGHANSKMTLDIYTDVFDEDTAKAVELLPAYEGNATSELSNPLVINDKTEQQSNQKSV